MGSSSPLAPRGTCGNSVSPSSPSPSPTAYNTAESITKKKLWELRLLCRLIGMHSRPNIEKGQRFNVYLPIKEDVETSALTGFKSHPSGKPVRLEGSTGPLSSIVNVKALGTVDIGANTKCLFFLNDEEDHLFICFNWFDPKNLVDIFSLTCRIASTFKLQQENSTAGTDSQEHENTMLAKVRRLPPLLA
ncbi:hypothetical protein TGMAS_209515 [Toxoplasma gondii MAS]|uniref:Uncharacterized protein n=1 Tax=Toxoplasma gondii MAS TaxID=943118 RepID=A0A086QS91_TOXGO|nr:hypothetical protein TGMAS_209515 [Toxoplasma gondii MAS]